MGDIPKITLITPCYNHGEFLEKTITSVLAQDYPNLEYIIIDGGSTDSSIDIIKRYEKHLAHWVSEKDRGQSHAINKGFRRATGDVLTWLNSDDWLEPGALHCVAKHAMQHPDAGAFVGHGRIVDISGKQIYYREAGELTYEKFCQWLDGGDFLQPSCFFRRSAWNLVEPLDENTHIAFDVDLWLRMAKSNISFQRIDALLSTSLAHERAKTTAFRTHMVIDTAVVVIRAGGEQYVRKRLDDIATRFSYYEANYNKIMNHPLVKCILPIVRLCVKPAVRMKDVTPRW
jgi:glycosyltransferase involved in cell wall biosynthesis